MISVAISFISCFIYLSPLFFPPTKGLYILLIFQKQFLIFSTIFFLGLFYFPSKLYYFFLLTLGFVCSFFILLDGRLGCLFDIFLVSWGKPKFCSVCKFGKLCFCFHLSQGIFWFLLWFFHSSIGVLVACCLVFMCLCFSFFYLWLISSFIVWSEKMLNIIPIPLHLVRLILWPSMCSVLENVPHALGKNVYSAILGI